MVRVRDREVHRKVKFETCVVIGIILMIILLVMLGLFAGIYNEKAELEAYNNGVCKQCGGKYEYLQAIGHKDYTTYLYKCRQCGKMLELSEAR